MREGPQCDVALVVVERKGSAKGACGSKKVHRRTKFIVLTG